MAGTCTRIRGSKNKICGRPLDPVKDVTDKGRPFKNCQRCREKRLGDNKRIREREETGGALGWVRHCNTTTLIERLGIPFIHTRRGPIHIKSPLAEAFYNSITDLVKIKVIPFVPSCKETSVGDLLNQPDFLQTDAEELLSTKNYRNIWGRDHERCCTNVLDINDKNDYEMIVYFIRSLIANRWFGTQKNKAARTAKRAEESEKANQAEEEEDSDIDEMTPPTIVVKWTARSSIDSIETSQGECSSSDLSSIPISPKQTAQAEAQKIDKHAPNASKPSTKRACKIETVKEPETASERKRTKVDTTAEGSLLLTQPSPSIEPNPTPDPAALGTLAVTPEHDRGSSSEAPPTGVSSSICATTEPFTPDTISLERKIKEEPTHEAPTRASVPPLPELAPEALSELRSKAFDSLMQVLGCSKPEPTSTCSLSDHIYVLYTPRAHARMGDKLGGTELAAAVAAMRLWTSINERLDDFRNTTQYFGRHGPSWQAHKRKLQEDKKSWKETFKPAIEAYRGLSVFVDEKKKASEWPEDKLVFATNLARFYDALLEQRGFEADDLVGGFVEYNEELLGWFET